MNIYKISKDELLGIVTPIAERMQNGWDVDNYEQFSESFTEDMKEVVDKERYEKQRKRIFPTLGTHTKLELIAIHENPGNIIVMWKLHCTKREIPALVQYTFIEKDKKVQVLGVTIHY